MEVTLYNNLSPKNSLNKELVSYITLTGTLKNGVNVLTPSIDIDIRALDGLPIVDSDYVDIMDENNYDIVEVFNAVNDVNYCFLSGINRFYFITSMDVLSTFIVRINCRIDVLQTYSSEILSQNAFVTRNQYVFNNMIRDDLVSFTYDKTIEEYIPSRGSTINTQFSSNSSGNSYAITVINNDLTYGPSNVSPPDTSLLPYVSSVCTGSGFSSKTYVTTYLNIGQLCTKLLSSTYSHLTSYILSIIALPFAVPTNGSPRYLVVGETTIDNINVVPPSSQNSRYFTIADFTITGSSFLDFEPFTMYEIFLPFLGWVNLNADVVLNNRIIVTYIVDYSTGQAQVIINDITNHKLIYTSTCQVGVNISINSTNAHDISNNRLLNNISLGLGLTSSAVSMAVGIASENPVAIMGSALSGASAVSKFIGNYNSNYVSANGSISGGYSGLYLPSNVRIRKTKLKPKNYDNNYAKLFGKPLNEYRKLSTLTGYTEVGKINIENMGNASEEEKNDIIALLENGIII